MRMLPELADSLYYSYPSVEGRTNQIPEREREKRYKLDHTNINTVIDLHVPIKYHVK